MTQRRTQPIPTAEQLNAMRISESANAGIQASLEILQEMRRDVSESKTHITEIQGEIKAAAGKLQSIEAQTIKTNGRVVDLELWRSKREGQIALAIALAGVGGGIVGFLATLVIQIFLKGKV